MQEKDRRIRRVEEMAAEESGGDYWRRRKRVEREREKESGGEG